MTGSGEEEEGEAEEVVVDEEVKDLDNTLV